MGMTAEGIWLCSKQRRTAAARQTQELTEMTVQDETTTQGIKLTDGGSGEGWPAARPGGPR